MTITPETPSLDPLEDLFEDARQLQTQSRALRTRTTFAWGPHPESEIARLTERLRSHVQSDGLASELRTHTQRRAFVFHTLNHQSGTCYLAGGIDKYCWNHPKNRHLPYL